VINEWMAANAHSVVDPFDGDFDDWFELYNPSSEPMALGGYTLSDSTNLPPSFTIPDGYILPAGGYRVVWADRETEQFLPPNGDLHVNFRLGQGGDGIVLRAPDGRIIDAVSFGPQTDDVSQGRWPNGAEGWVFFDRPTPGSANRADPPVDEVRITAGLINNLGQFVLVIQSEPGKRYRMQAADDLAAPNWLYVSDVLTAAETTLTWTAEVSSASPHRFYRVERQP
jgi:hypothetical protein